MAFYILSKIKSFLFENKTTRQIILKNSFWLWLAEMIGKGSSFIIAILLARHFGATIYGQWAFAISFVSLFAVFAEFGFSILVISEVSKDKSKTPEYIDNILAMKTILGILVFIAISIIIQFFRKEQAIVQLVYFLAGYIIINTFALFFRSIAQANERMEYEAVCRSINGLSLLALVAFFVFGNFSIVYIGLAYLLSAVITTAASLLIVWHNFSTFFKKIDRQICKDILSGAWPLAFGNLFSVVYGQVDTIMLSVMKTDLDVGLYNAPYSFISGLSIIPALIISAIYPKLSHSFLNSKQTFLKLYKTSLKYILLLVVILIPPLFILAPQITFLLYGTEYMASVLAFRILLFSEACIFISYIFSYSLYAMGKQIIYARTIVGCLLLNIILNFLLIPGHSYVGASIAAAIPNFFQITILFLLLKKFLNVNNLTKNGFEK